MNSSRDFLEKPPKSAAEKHLGEEPAPVGSVQSSRQGNSQANHIPNW